MEDPEKRSLMNYETHYGMTEKFDLKYIKNSLKYNFNNSEI